MMFDERSEGWVLCGNMYQLELAWQFIGLVLDGQMSIHNHLRRQSSSGAPPESRNTESSHDRRAAGITRKVQSAKSYSSHSKFNTDNIAVDPRGGSKVRKKKLSAADVLGKPVKKEALYESLKNEDIDIHVHPYTSLDKTEQIRREMKNLDMHIDSYSRSNPRDNFGHSSEHGDYQDSDTNLRNSLSPDDFGSHRVDVLKRVERSDTNSSPSSDSDADADGFGIGGEHGKTSTRHKKPRTEITSALRNADADGTFEEFSKMSVSEERGKDYSHGKGMSSHLNQHERSRLETGEALSKQDEHSHQKSSVTHEKMEKSLKRRSHSPSGSTDLGEEIPVGGAVGLSAIDAKSELSWKDYTQPFTFTIGDLTVFVYCGDIRMETCHGIVNAAIGSLINGAGVARAISVTASPKMQQECDNYVREHGPLATSAVIHTRAGGKFSSDVRCILHTVGPIWSEREKDRCFYELTKTFLNCLIYAEKQKLRSIAFPLISSGKHCSSSADVFVI